VADTDGLISGVRRYGEAFWFLRKAAGGTDWLYCVTFGAVMRAEREVQTQKISKV
jgi:hypothetical protein